MPASPQQPIRILLVDDHLVVRTALSGLIQTQDIFKVVGEASNRKDALEIAEREKPDIILLDIELGNESGLDFIIDLLAVNESTRIIVLTGVRDPETHQRAVSLGAMGVVQKEKAFEVLVRAIEQVNAGEAWIDPSLVARIVRQVSSANKPKPLDYDGAKIASLTDREREVVTLIGDGLKNKEIADKLFISEWTVRHHITSIFSKLEVTDRVELILYAYKHGLATPPR